MFFFKFFKKYIHLFILFCSVKQSFFIKNINIKYLNIFIKKIFLKDNLNEFITGHFLKCPLKSY